MEELLFDRWERAKCLGFGEGSSIYHISYIYGDVKVGENTWIGPFTVLDGSGGLIIGDYCDISSVFQIYSHDTIKRSLSGGRLSIDKAPVNISSYCHIGPQTIITKGVTIGSYSIIGACSVITKDISEYSIVVGPGRIIGKVAVNGDQVTYNY
jgi:acetyltransferase-like isoleucine patch superfamily enzyme